MFVSFFNRCDENKMVLRVNGSVYELEPQNCTEIPVNGERVDFSVEILPVDLSSGLENEEKSEKFTKKILFRLAKKIAEKIPDMGLYTNCDYVLSDITDGITVDLYEGVYSVADGNVAEYLFDMVPIVYCFARKSFLIYWNVSLSPLVASISNSIRSCAAVSGCMIFFPLLRLK